MKEEQVYARKRHRVLSPTGKPDRPESSTKPPLSKDARRAAVTTWALYLFFGARTYSHRRYLLRRAIAIPRTEKRLLGTIESRVYVYGGVRKSTTNGGEKRLIAKIIQEHRVLKTASSAN